MARKSLEFSPVRTSARRRRVPLPNSSRRESCPPAFTTDDGWADFRPIGAPVNTPEDDYLASVSNQGTLFLQAAYEDSHGDHDLYSCTRRADGTYEAARNLGGQVNTEASESAPWVSADETFLVYCAFAEPGYRGGSDLYVSFRQADGTWGKGVNLGPDVNTAATEKFPSLSADEKYLFFVSDRGAERSYALSDLTYDELITRNLGPRNGKGDVYWVSSEVIHRLHP